MLSLGNLLAMTLDGHEPVEKIQHTCDGTRLRWLTEGALEVSPAPGVDSGVDLLVSTGLHGNETAPIELVDLFVRRIASSDLKPAARILFLLGNTESMRAGVRYLQNDINRLFFGRHNGVDGREATRAGELERLACEFFSNTDRYQLHYDLHTAIRGSKIEKFALYPWAEGRKRSRVELARLHGASINTVLLQNKPGITFSAYTYGHLGVEAFTLELGSARPFGNNTDVDLSGIQAVLEQLIEGQEQLWSDGAVEQMQLFTVSREVVKRSDEFRLNLADDVQNFTELEEGLLLAEDVGGALWIVEERQARIIFPNPHVNVGLRAGLIIVPLNGELV
ncbi:succinylglutamate desuccinylase [Pseudomonas syringae]|uniref:succinylglutamate desuccinylase n=1 Tax=Pseudomonas sp. MWU16-30316 TaxID=2878093 RepID=UPI00110544EE|nr:succinylglutamate desuccinylase [Pseudomonas sp. MWU16-30316]TFZ36172.1 succinylglutamate desuccinylase [Pseudomonas syringae]